MAKKIIIIGGGGHARVLLDILQSLSCDIIGFTDLKPNDCMGIKYLGTDDVLKNYSSKEYFLVNGVGSVRLPKDHQEIYEKLKKMGYEFYSVIHPKSVISPKAKQGEGIQVMGGVVINTGTALGENVIVNTSASIDHDCVIGAHTHIAPGVTVSGGVTIGKSCHIGTGANIIQGIRLGSNILVPAGMTVRQDYQDGQIVSIPGLPRPSTAGE